MMLPAVICKNGKPTFLGLSLGVSIASAVVTIVKIIPEGSPWIRNSALVFLLCLIVLVRLDIFIANRTELRIKHSDEDYPKNAITALVTQGCIDVCTVLILFELLNILFEMY
ncbi:MAG: hypothetical protein ACRCXX_08080, partial [Cetobacterium sp.]|uniref:hypothetical protein n=1 Tax=Cetobacterium sp. TaxID=2071632 RepID=UPI003F358CBE